jgi:hypothetical protein
MAVKKPEAIGASAVALGFISRARQVLNRVERHERFSA